MNRVVVETEPPTNFIEEFWLLNSRRVRSTRSPSWCFEMADKGHKAKMPKNSTTILVSRQNGTLINGWT
jgi:hypothetical protein